MSAAGPGIAKDQNADKCIAVQTKRIHDGRRIDVGSHAKLDDCERDKIGQQFL